MDLEGKKISEFPSDIAFTPAVKSIQEQKGSRRFYARMERSGGWQTSVTPELAEYLADLDMFYLGTANADGHPYIQYRGGPPGLLKVIDEQTLGFADFGGNRQYITVGNLLVNPKAYLFLMDYAKQRRVKLWGTARVLEGDAALKGGSAIRRTQARSNERSCSRSRHGTSIVRSTFTSGFRRGRLHL